MKILFQIVLPLNTDNSKYLSFLSSACVTAQTTFGSALSKHFCIEMYQTVDVYERIHGSFKGRRIVACQ